MKKGIFIFILFVVSSFVFVRGVGAVDLTFRVPNPTQGSQVLVNEELLLDMGSPCNGDSYCLDHQEYEIGVARFRGYGIDMDKIKYILITHGHGDHLNLDKLVELAGARSVGATKLWLGAGDSQYNITRNGLIARNKGNLFTLKKFDPYETYEIGPYKITAFVASHGEPPPWPASAGFFVYGVEYAGKKILLAQDTGPFSEETTNQMKVKMGKFDYIYIENTFTRWRKGAAEPYQGGFNNFIIHMNNCELNTMFDNWKNNLGLIDDQTVIKYMHIASWFNDNPGIGWSALECPNMRYGSLSTRNDFVRYTISTPSATPTPTSTPVTKLGDATGDGLVNLADFVRWKKEFTGALATKTADFNSDGNVNLADFVVWKKNL